MTRRRFQLVIIFLDIPLTMLFVTLHVRAFVGLNDIEVFATSFCILFGLSLLSS